MTDATAEPGPVAGQQIYAGLMADAVRALTDAARLRKRWTTSDGGVFDMPVDWAEFVTHAVATTAANIGDIEGVLAGRSGSWEADNVRQLLYGTLGEGDEATLLRHRTDPVNVTVYVGDLLRGRQDKLFGPSLTGDHYDDAATTLGDRLIDEDTDEDVAVNEPIRALQEKVEKLRFEDRAAYGRALTAHIEAAGADFPVPVRVACDDTIHKLNIDFPEVWPDQGVLENRLLWEAVAAVELPGEGRTPLERVGGLPG